MRVAFLSRQLRTKSSISHRLLIASNTITKILFFTIIKSVFVPFLQDKSSRYSLLAGRKLLSPGLFIWQQRQCSEIM